MIDLKLIDSIPSLIEGRDKFVTIHAKTGYCKGQYIGICSEGVLLSRSEREGYVLISFSDIVSINRG